MLHIHNGILLKHKNNEIMLFAATWVDLEIITLSEVSQKKTNTIWYHLYVKSKVWYKWTYLPNGNRLTDIEGFWLPKSRGGGKGWEFGISRCKQLYRMINNKVLPDSTVSYITYPMINHNENYICIYIYLNCFDV